MFLEWVDERNVFSLEDLKEFFNTNELTQEHFEDVKKLKKWIAEVPECIWYIEEIEADIDLPGYHIIQYVWDE